MTIFFFFLKKVKERQIPQDIMVTLASVPS